MIEGNNPLNDDFYRMANAPYLVCGIQHFVNKVHYQISILRFYHFMVHG